LSDWAAPENGLDRALPGDGIANLPTMCAQLLAAGFTGWWEVEVLSERLWAGDQRELVSATHRAATEVLDKARALLDGEEARR
jgi:sugar phosphate isomerase/epimerase